MGEDWAGGPPRPRIGRLLGSVGRIAVLVFVGLNVYLYLMQERMLFFPQPLDAAAAARVTEAEPRARDLELRGDGGVRLHGWLLRAESDGPAPLVIYFGGNAEEASALVVDPLWPRDWNVALVNYRGYGLSEGKPGQDALFADALAVFDALAANPAVDASRVVAFGRSLGTGVAVHLAAERPLAGVILLTPYDSITRVAQAMYPFLPVKWLLRHPFDSVARAPDIHTPMLALAAGRDEVIPPEHARRLFEAWGGPRTWRLFEGAGHNDVSDAAGYAEAVLGFLATVAAPDG